MRAVYKNATEMRQEFRTRLGDYRFFATESGLDRLKRFLKAFNLTKDYPVQWWIDQLDCPTQFEIPSGTKEIHLCMVRHQMYQLFNNFLTYTVPTTEVITAIASFVGQRTLHEHMAGSGYWAYLLGRRGVDVKAFDRSTPSIHPISEAKTFVPIGVADVNIAKLPTDAVLMLSWIPHGDTSPIKLLQQMVPGQRLVYIGDRGCCADYEFHDYLETNYLELAAFNPPKLMLLKDGVWLYERRQQGRQPSQQSQTVLSSGVQTAGPKLSCKAHGAARHRARRVNGFVGLRRT